MKKETSSSKGNSRARHGRRPCLMAYTIDNKQPVICTIVADQPYFYMEDENASLEDDMLGFEEYADFEKDIADLKQKMAAYERLSRSFERDPQSRLDSFVEAAGEITGETSSPEECDVAQKVIERLSQSRMAKSLYDFAQEHGVEIYSSTQVQAARYDRDAARIFIHASLSETEATLLAVRELRRHWQHKKGVMIHPLTFYPDQAILINRAQMADLSVAMVRAAWEMQLAGDRAAWEFVESSAMSDLGRAFAREAFVDFRSLSSGKAASAAFETWFLSERCRHQDKKLIQSMLADHQGYVFSTPEASRNVSIELIMALGEQTFGKNYLAPYARTIIEDPVFTEVRDRSNANFLWFIKFERSFRETEQALQSEEGATLRGDIPSFAPPEDTGIEEHGIIIPHPSSAGLIHRTEGFGGQGNLEGSDPSANVIHVMFGNAKSL